MTVDELIEELRSVPNRQVPVCVTMLVSGQDEGGRTFTTTQRRAIESVSWQGSHVTLIEAERPM